MALKKGLPRNCEAKLAGETASACVFNPYGNTYFLLTALLPVDVIVFQPVLSKFLPLEPRFGKEPVLIARALGWKC
jgi:hypothetical protein